MIIHLLKIKKLGISPNFKSEQIGTPESTVAIVINFFFFLNLLWAILFMVLSWASYRCVSLEARNRTGPGGGRVKSLVFSTQCQEALPLSCVFVKVSVGEMKGNLLGKG